LSNGAVDPAWPQNGRAVCTALGDQTNPAVVSDASGGILIAWRDQSHDVNYQDIVAQHVSASGVLDSAWPVNGLLVRSSAFRPFAFVLVEDGAGGGLLLWARGLVTGPDTFQNRVYAHHLLAAGALDPSWPSGGLPVCSFPAEQTNPSAVSDGANGLVVTWQDGRSAPGDVYANHILAAGNLDPG